MTQKICISNCMFHVDGRCRLEHRQGERTPVCPHYVGYGMSRGGI